MNDTDWTTPEGLSNIVAQELVTALVNQGIHVVHCGGTVDGRVSVSFQELRDADAMLTLAVPGSDTPGSLYDRATGGCVALSSLAEAAELSSLDVNDAEALAAIQSGWEWSVHPHLTGRRAGWHVTVDIPLSDASAVTAALNAL